MNNTHYSRVLKNGFPADCSDLDEHHVFTTPLLCSCLNSSPYAYAYAYADVHAYAYAHAYA